MAVLSSRLVITLQDNVSGPAARIKSALGQLRGVMDSARTQPFRMMAEQAKAVHREVRGAATVSGALLAGLVQQTQGYREQEWGYQFARIPEYMDGATLKLSALKAETKAVSNEARGVARAYGLMPEQVMRARTEVQKIGIAGKTGDSLWHAALGLTMGDAEMPTEVGVQYLGAMFRSYADQRKELAAQLGVDMNDDKQRSSFEDAWLRGLAAKSSIAATESALGPRELVAGARQYAPVWASLGMRPEEVLGSLAHGSNYGFGGIELGTAFKSWANRLTKPTAGGMRWMNNLRIDRTAYADGMGAADPAKAATALNSLLGNQLYAGKGGNGFKLQLRSMLDEAQKTGTTATPEFIGAMTAAIQGKLGAGWAGKEAEVEEAVRNAVLTPTGNISITNFIREALKKGMPKAAMLEVLEGRHVARNTPLFKYFDKMVEMIKKIDRVGAAHLDGIVGARKDSDAGKIVALQGAWQDLLITLSQSPAIGALTNALLTLSNVVASMDPSTLQTLTYGLIGLAGVGAVGGALVLAAGGLRVLRAATLGLAVPIYWLTRMAAALTSMSMAASTARTALGVLAAATVLKGTSGIGAGYGLGNAAGAGAAAGAAAGGARGFWTRLWGGTKKVAPKLIPGIGMAVTAYQLSEAYAAYKKTGRLSDAGLAFFGFGSAQAAERPAETLTRAGHDIAAGRDPARGPGLGPDLTQTTTDPATGLPAGRRNPERDAPPAGAGADMSQMLGIDNIGRRETTGGGPQARAADAATGLPAGRRNPGNPERDAPPAGAGADMSQMLGIDSIGRQETTGGPQARAADAATGLPAGRRNLERDAAAPGAGADTAQMLGIDSIGRQDATGGPQAQAADAAQAVRDAMSQIRSAVAAVDLTSEGARIAQSLADGIRSGIGEIQAAAREMVDAAARNAVRGAYSDGGLQR